MGACCVAQGAQFGAPRSPRGVGWWGWKEVQEGGEICIQMAD